MSDNFQIHLPAFKRILEVCGRQHLYDPFKRSNLLRAKHFPGSGPTIPFEKLREAYLQEFIANKINWQLIEHATWPWIQGHKKELTLIFDELSKVAGQTKEPNTILKLKTEKQQNLVQRYTQTGAEEITIFWSIFIHAGRNYQKSILCILSETKASASTDQVKSFSLPTTSQTPPPTVSSPVPVRTGEPLELDPKTRAFYALLGILIFFLPSLFLVGIQFWRLPRDSHWVVVGIATVLGLLTLACLIDYLRKRKE